MTSTDQERWQRVKERLRNRLGDDVFSSWFGRMELEAVDRGVVRLSVPTRFLRNWIQSHYSERVLSQMAGGRARHHSAGIERSLGRDPSAGAKPKPAEPPAPA
jgi:chromosomal replication initiator protein